MQKPLAAYANDLADHDVIDDDSDLIFGPHPSKLSITCSVAQVPIGRQLLGGCTSFKTQHLDTSILGSAPLAAKLAQSLLAAPPPPPMRAARTSTPDSSHVYAGGNPIISTAPAASRPGSATPRLPRASAPSGAATTTTTAAASKSVHGGAAADSEPAAAAAALRRQQDGAEPRMQGDLQPGDRDPASAPRPRSALLRRLSSLTGGGGGGSRPHSRPPSAQQEATDGGAAALSGRAAATSPEGPAATYIPVRGSPAIPCMDGQPERSRLLRRLSLREGGTAAAAAPLQRPLPKDAVGSARQPLLQAADARGPEPQSRILGGTMNPSTAAAAAAAAPTASAAAPERPLTPLRRLSRLLSGSLITPPPAPRRLTSGTRTGRARARGGLAARGCGSCSVDPPLHDGSRRRGRRAAASRSSCLWRHGPTSSSSSSGPANPPGAAATSLWATGFKSLGRWWCASPAACSSARPVR